MKRKQWLIGAAGCGATAAFVVTVALAGRQEPTVIVRPSAPVPAAPVALKQAAPVIDLTKKVRQPFVDTTFRAQGVKRFSSGGCTQRWKHGCTSYEGMRRGTVEGILAFRKASRCKVTVSGGTEKGHARMRFSHENGYKIDIMPTKCVTKYIHRTMKKVGERSDGSEMYRVRPGQLFANEHDTHWDIFYGPEWCVKRLIRHRACG
ncbi:hypothetical protein [Actinocorallia longicatena]|uniref:Uncharacterized protein n=1 Tax=Actinocorallia longicatena TaxID=111803 RepID=A0ABP6Q9I3_9ACTN